MLLSRVLRKPLRQQISRLRRLHVQRVRLMIALRLCLRFMLNFTNNAAIQSRHCKWWRRILWPTSRHWPVLIQSSVNSHLLQQTAVNLCWKCMGKLIINGRKHVWHCKMLPRTHRLTGRPLLAHSMKSFVHSRGLVMPWVILDTNCNSSYQDLWTTKSNRHCR